NNLYNSRRHTDDLLRDPTTPAPVRTKLLRLKELRAYAHSQGLAAGEAYRYYIHLPEPSVSYVVQAAYPDRLQSLTWWFPIVGTVPYLGFFDRQARDEKAAELSRQGYDVETAGVSAFSSLGWFEDPIYSPMLERSPAAL